MNLRKKIIIGSIVACATLGVGLFGLTQLLSIRVNSFVLSLASKMTEQIGHPVLIERVSTKWDFLFLKVNIKNLQILDKDTNFPLFMAQEIVSTVDALDSIRSFGLKFKQLLIRSPRLVMQFDQNNMPVILGLGNKDVAGDVDLSSILSILAMQRRVIIENGDLHLQGCDGADLPFMGLRIDMRHIDTQEYTMVVRGNIAAAIQPEFVLAVRYYGELPQYKNAMVDFEIKTSNLQMEDLFNFMPQLRQDIITGNFADFDLQGIIQNGTLRQVTTDFTINDINIENKTHIKGGVGHIEYKPGNNNASLQLARINIENKKLYNQPITIDSISTDVTYNLSENGALDISTNDARVKFMDLELRPQLQMQFTGNDLNNLKFAMQPTDASIRRLLVLLPDQLLSPGLVEWFKRSIIDGEVNLIQAERNANKMRYAIGFKDGELRFASNWPSVYDIDAILEVNDGKLSINATRAMILGESLKRLNTNYDLSSNKPAVISIDGAVDTSLEAALNYLQQTPLQESLATKFAPYNPTGPMDLALHLDIDLSQSEINVDVNGAMRLSDAALDVTDIKIPVENINGVVTFTKDNFAAQNLKMRIFDENANARIAKHPNKAHTINIAIDLAMQMKALQKTLPDLDLSKLQGATQMRAILELPWGSDKQPRTLLVNSDMVGVSINYPAPFNKSAQSKMPLQLQYTMHNKRADMVKFSCGTILDGVLYLKDKELQSGRIAVNKKVDDLNESDHLSITGEIKHVDWSAWQPLLNTDGNSKVPIDFDLKFKTLTFAKENYSPVHVKYNTGSGVMFLDTSIATGTIKANLDVDRKIEVKLERLVVPENRSKNTAVIDFLQEKRKQGKLPTVQFNCKNLQFNKRSFKNVQLDLLPRNYGFEISNLSINNDNILLQAVGNWQMDQNTLTNLSGNIYTQNFGKVLAEWGYENSISRGKGEMSFSVNWDGGPMDFDVLKLAGSAHLDLRSGSLTNVNPGIGRIIGLLSLESIQRRLQLDFSDLLSKGFAFDKLLADFKIEPGSILSDNILITSPSAKIELSGKTGIKSQDLDLTMFVTPKVGASLPIAAAIAAGPAVGAAIWLFDKASGSKISEITKYKYKVTGTWNAPEVNEVPNQDKVVG